MNQKLEKNDQVVQPSEIPLSDHIHNLHTDPFETAPGPIWQPVEPSEIPPFDDLHNLYIGPIENAPGSVSTAEGEFPAAISGEVLLYGRIIDNAFVVQRLRRVALYGALESPEADPRIDVFSLAGPLEEPMLESGPAGIVTSFVEQLHYGALSSDLDPLIKSDDAVFPQVEQIAAQLGLNQQGEWDEKTAQINISFISEGLVDKKSAIVQKITLDPITINFFLAGTGAPSPEPHHSLQSNCPSPDVGSHAVIPCPPSQQTFTRSLSLKFINFTRTGISPEHPENPGYPVAEVEEFCDTQIEGLCEVWRNQAALQFVVQDTLIEASTHHKKTFYALTALQENTRSESGTSSIEKQGYDSKTQIEIYLVEKFAGDSHGGAISYNSGQASAYCILALDQVGGNPYLLAHELGHVLGLAHPWGTPNLETSGLIDSSPLSIMQPSNPAGSPNPNHNTLLNCRVFLPPQPVSPASPTAKTLNGKVLDPQPPLNPSVSSPGAADCFRPDSVPPSA